MSWVLPPLSNSWIIFILRLYIALNRTPNIDCYWVGAVPRSCHYRYLGGQGHMPRRAKSHSGCGRGYAYESGGIAKVLQSLFCMRIRIAT